MNFLDKHGGTYGQSVDGILLALNACWCIFYTGYRSRIRSDQRSVFTSNRWREIAESKSIQIHLPGARAYSFVVLGENLNNQLRQIYRKMQHDYPSANPRMILRAETNAMFDTINEKGLVPSILVFGIMPRFPIGNSKLTA